jgi:AMMECR1 domain-containing protein
MWNVQKVYVSAVKTQWKHMKTLANLCISCRIYGTCVFWYTREMYKKFMFLQWKHSENTWKHMKTLANYCISCGIYGTCVF